MRLAARKNAKSPIVLTLLGIVMLPRPDAPENADAPMLVTLLGDSKATDVKLDAA